MNTTPRAWGLAIGLALCLHTGLASALTVSPVHLKMAPSVRTVTFTAVNDQAYPATIRAKLRRWQQDGVGNDQLGSAPELVVYPLKAVLKPGHRQDFRVFLKVPAPDSRYYRLLIELADNRPAQKGTINVGQAFSVPLFVEQPLARPLLQMKRDGKALQITNAGSGFEFIKALRYASGERNSFVYLLPGASKRVPLPVAANGSTEWPTAIVGRQLGALAIP